MRLSLLFPIATQTMLDRFAYCEGTYLFWSQHHGGQCSDGYARMSRIIDTFKFNPSPLFDWDYLGDGAKDVYRMWCKRENVDCDYDKLTYLLESADFDLDDPCIDYLVDRYNDDPEALENYDRSDFVNCDMCYTRDLLRFYDHNETEIKAHFEEMCDAYGYTSTLEALQGDTIEDPDDMKAAMVNHAMTYLARRMLDAVNPDR